MGTEYNISQLNLMVLNMTILKPALKLKQNVYSMKLGSHKPK